MKTHDKYQKFFGDHFENTSEIQTKPIITEREKPPSGYIQNKWKQLLEKIKFSNQFLKAMTGNYDSFKVPPDWTLAENHQKATAVGYEVQYEADQERNLCPCCGYLIEKIPVEMKEPTENLSFLGPGYPLYFHFLKNTIYLLLIILLISGEFNIFSNYLSDNCIVLSDTTTSSSEDDGNSVFCVLDLITMFSLVNKTSKNEANEIQHYLNFSSVIGVIIFMIFYRKNQKELFLRIDLKETTPSDYTIIVKNIPTDLNIDIEKSLYEYFNFVDSKQYDVQNINLCYDLTERVKIHKAFQQLLKKKKQILISANANTNEKLTADLEKVNEEIEKKEFEMRNYDINISNNYPHFCGIALVTFNTVEEKREIIKKSRLTLFDRLRIFFNNRVHLPRGFLYYNSRLIIEQAPEPNEIQFNNLHSDSKEKFKIRIFTFLLTLLEMAGFGIIIYILLSYQYGYCKGVVASLQASQSFEESDEEMLEYYTEMLYVYLISGGISLLIVIINNVLVFFITKKIVKMEKYSTYTKKKISSAVRLSLILFFNNSIIVYFICKAENQITTPGGLIYTQYYVFIVNAIGPLFTKTLDIPLQIKKIKIWYYKKFGSHKLNQKEANKLYQYPKYEIQTVYAETVKTILFTSFYSALLPCGIIWSLLSLCLLYLHHKKSLLGKRSVTKLIGGGLSRVMTNMLELAIIFTALGNLIFEYDIFGAYMTIDIIGIGISILYFISPTRWIAEKLFLYKDETEEKRYCDIYQKFFTDYDIENPATSFKALKKKINLEKNKNVEKIRNTIRNKTINLNDHSKANNEEKLKSPKKWLMKKSIVPGFLRIQKRNAAKMLETYEKASPFKLNINEGESEIFSSFSSPNKKFHEK